MKFFSRHIPTEAQSKAIKDLFGDELVQVDAALPTTYEAMVKFLEEQGLGWFEPVAMVAPVNIIELVRDHTHPVIVFTTPQRGQLVDEAAAITVTELFGYGTCDSDAGVRINGKSTQAATVVQIEASYWYITK